MSKPSGYYLELPTSISLKIEQFSKMQLYKLATDCSSEFDFPFMEEEGCFTPEELQALNDLSESAQIQLLRWTTELLQEKIRLQQKNSAKAT